MSAALRSSEQLEDFTDALTRLAQRLLPDATGIANARRLSGGATQETWSFDAVTPNVVPLILRRMPANNRTVDGAVGIENEAEIVARCAERHLPVPRVLGVLVPGDLLGRGFVMERVEGEAIPRKLLKDECFAAIRPHLAAQFGATLAAIHGVNPSSLPALPVRCAAEEIAVQAGRIDHYAITNPVFALALRWLERNCPATPEHPALVHGDFRTGNILVDARGVAAVLDWELAHLGDPMEDLGWVCMNSWRFGNVDKPAGGFGTRAELFHAYQTAGGRSVDETAVLFWEVLGALRWGISCTSMCEVFATGGDPTPERAMIARRASETAADILALITRRN